MFVEQKGRVANLDGGGQSSPVGISSTKVSKQFFTAGDKLKMEDDLNLFEYGRQP